MEITPEEIDQETENGPEIATTDAGVETETFEQGEMTREIEIACLEMVLLTPGESVAEKIAQNASFKRTQHMHLARLQSRPLQSTTT